VNKYQQHNNSCEEKVQFKIWGKMPKRSGAPKRIHIELKEALISGKFSYEIKLKSSYEENSQFKIENSTVTTCYEWHWNDLLQ